VEEGEDFLSLLSSFPAAAAAAERKASPCFY